MLIRDVVDFLRQNGNSKEACTSLLEICLANGDIPIGTSVAELQKKCAQVRDKAKYLGAWCKPSVRKKGSLNYLESIFKIKDEVEDSQNEETPEGRHQDIVKDYIRLQEKLAQKTNEVELLRKESQEKSNRAQKTLVEKNVKILEEFETFKVQTEANLRNKESLLSQKNNVISELLDKNTKLHNGIKEVSVEKESLKSQNAALEKDQAKKEKQIKSLCSEIELREKKIIVLQDRLRYLEQ
eukprot:TRINITY_DN11135_c0_g1_i15.p1 TRINITY_DN11135_c0_g1~~TRINITY_DN11135_c0_g1_i15.p1  ORF type:complete len:240 (+),score=46.94 TRINITY_DN11135_c0_g1_i15:87-806(+)